MHQIPRFATLSCAAILIASSASAQRQWTVTGQDVPELAAVDQMMQNVMQGNDIRGGSVAIAKDGRLVYARGFTWDQPEQNPVQPTTLFRIGSIGKSITSIAIHQLIEQGLLAYDTPVLPTLGLQPLGAGPRDPRLDAVTVDHLLTHTSGIYSHDDIYTAADVVAVAHGVETPPTKREIASYMIAQPFRFDPGSSWDYNNYGYILLGMLAELMTGRDFPEFVLDNIFRPVGVGRARMAHTLRADLAPTETSYDGVEGDPYSTMAEQGFAAGLILMSAPDLARIYSALFDHPEASGLLHSNTVEEMISTPYAAGADLGYGRGWVNEDFFAISGHPIGSFTDTNDSFQVYGHGGGGSGVHTLAVWRSDGTVFVWMTNKDPVVEAIEFPENIVWPSHDLWESVGISPNPVGSAPTESWVPAIAHTAGVGDSLWRSDVGLLNRSSLPNIVRLRYLGSQQAIDRELQLTPGESRVLTDILGWLGRKGSGPLQIFSSEALTVTSRTYNQSPEGTFGQALDGVTATGGLESGESAVLMQLREDDVTRTNIGIHNQWRRPARVEIALYDNNGILVTQHTREISAQQTLQLNRPFYRLGDRSDIESGYAVVRVLSGQDIYVYATVIDNTTGDPTAIPMKVAASADAQWIAAAAHSGGAHGSLWRTDLCLLNRSGTAALAEVTFHRDSGESGSITIDLNDGQQVVLGDVVAQAGMAGSGALEVVSDQPLLATSRTFNESRAGTFGLFLDGISTQDTTSRGTSFWLPQLAQNSGFRTNIGLLNTGDSRSRVRIVLYDGSGTEVASTRKNLDSSGWIQLQQPFSKIAGRNDIQAGYARIDIESGGGVIAYASVIDNATNDGTAITAKR